MLSCIVINHKDGEYKYKGDDGKQSQDPNHTRQDGPSLNGPNATHDARHQGRRKQNHQGIDGGWTNEFRSCAKGRRMRNPVGDQQETNLRHAKHPCCHKNLADRASRCHKGKGCTWWNMCSTRRQSAFSWSSGFSASSKKPLLQTMSLLFFVFFLVDLVVLVIPFGLSQGLRSGSADVIVACK